MSSNKPAPKDLKAQDYVATKEFKNRENRISTAMASNGKLSLLACKKTCLGTRKYRDNIYIGDLIYVLSNTSKFLPFELELILGQSISDAQAKVNASLEEIASMDKLAGRRKLNDVLSINNPALHLLKYLNSVKKELFESPLSELFEQEDFKHKKTVTLLKRNLAITSPEVRELAQAKYNIDTEDLKYDEEGRVLYLCKKCSSIEFIATSEMRTNHIKPCSCGSVLQPARHLLGLETSKGRIVFLNKSSAITSLKGKKTKHSTNDLIEFHLSEISGDEQATKEFTSKMLWHHLTHQGSCHCVECCSE